MATPRHSNVTVTIFTLVAAYFLSLALFGQGGPPPTSAPPNEVDALTRAKLETISLRQQLAMTVAERDICRGQVAPETYKATMTTVQRSIDDLVRDFEQRFPGFTIDLPTLKPKPHLGGGS